MDDENYFSSDDELGDLPANTLNQLEQQAFASTQQAQRPPQPSARPVPVPFVRKQAHNAASLNRAGNKNLPWRPPQPSRPSQPPPPSVPSAPPASAPKPPSSDYGYDDEDVIDLYEPSTVIQPAPQIQPSGQPRGQRPVSKHGGRTAELDPETEAAFAAADEELGSQTFGRWPRGTPPQPGRASATIDLSVMQARIAELEAEQARLRLSEQQARQEALAKQGEIAIVRSNQQKMTKQYEARLSVMQRLHADDAAKAKAELDAQRKEREKMETDNRFLQHDLAQEAERAKRLNGPARTKSTPRETPRKSKRAMLGDGFDDDEVRLMASPSRSKDKSKGDQTPRHGAKRKRTANDTPVAALSFTQPPQQMRHESTGGQSAVSFASVASEAVTVIERDSKYEFMQLILNHTPYEGHDGTVDSLAKYCFPSKPGKTLSSVFMHDISYPSPDDSLPLKTSRALLSLWSRCIEEKYFAPLYMILEMLRFVLQSELSSTKSQLLDQAIPLCSASIDFIATPTARASKNKAFAATLDLEALNVLAEELDVERILDFMDDLCNAASLSYERIETFWKTIEFTFTLQALNKAQPISHIITMLHMLQTSARDTTAGPISIDPQKQAAQENQLIERLTNLLFEMPEVPMDEEPYSDEEIQELRLEVLQVLNQMCQTDHGGLLLAQHRSAIGRMIRFLDAQVTKLYSARPLVGLSFKSGAEIGSSTHDLIIRTVNLTVRLIYHVVRTNETLELVPKVQVVHGGYHKFLVSLTRVAFSEQLVFESGIEDEVSEAAHQILDSVLGPEDGEAVVKAIETPKGTRGSGFKERAPSRGFGNGDGSQNRDKTMDSEDTRMSEPG